MRDDQVDAGPPLDVPAHPDPYFTDQSFAGLVRVARTAPSATDAFSVGGSECCSRVAGLSSVGRSVWPLRRSSCSPSSFLRSSRRRSSSVPDGHRGRDSMIRSSCPAKAPPSIDVDGTERATIISADSPIVGLSRSPDGRTMAFWTTTPTGHRFEVAGVDGTDRRRLGADLQLAWGGCIDARSPDSSRVAAQVSVDGTPGILVPTSRTSPSVSCDPPTGLPNARCGHRAVTSRIRQRAHRREHPRGDGSRRAQRDAWQVNRTAWS